MAVAAIFIQWWTVSNGYDLRTQQTAVFSTLCFVQLGNALSVRSMYHSLFSPGLFANHAMWGTIFLTVALQISIMYVPLLQEVFKTTSLSWQIILIILSVTLICMAAIELFKYFSRKKYYREILMPG